MRQQALPTPEDFWPLTRYNLRFPQQPSPPMTFTVKAHHKRYFATFSRKSMGDALAKANELVAAPAVTIQDENGFLYLESDFALLSQTPSNTPSSFYLRLYLPAESGQVAKRLDTRDEEVGTASYGRESGQAFYLSPDRALRNR